MNLGRRNDLYSVTHRSASEFLDGQSILEQAVLKPSIEVAVRLQPCALADVDGGLEELARAQLPA